MWKAKYKGNWYIVTEVCDTKLGYNVYSLKNPVGVDLQVHQENIEDLIIF